jgi:hypothetical protein
MTMPFWILCVLASVVLLTTEAQAEPLDPARVQQIATMLSDQPVGLGAPISDRAAWQGKPLPQAAERYLTEPLPDQPDDLFLDFSKTGNRSRWERVAFGRRGRLAPLVFAECVENKGRFLPAIETLIRALCAEKTWVLPAHDSRLTNFKGEDISIDLASSALGWNLATADWLLGEKLAPEVRRLLRDSVQRFVNKPYHDMITGARPPNWWMLTNSNWNAVCLAGVTGAALPLVQSKQERAEVIAAAEMYSLNFLRGFTPDGYCSEGLGYWNYGFGHYVLLSETIRQATGDKLDLLARPEAKAPALFPTRIMADDQIGPAFADCHINSRPAATYMFYLNRVFQLGYKRWDTLSDSAIGGNLFEGMIFAFPSSASKMPPATGAEPARELRSWFGDAGVLVARPTGNPAGKLAVALKGGHNAELHNHNDVGSYTVFLSGRMPLLDPGSEVYTQRTFSSRRYESKLLNSFGHPVPVIAGQLQRPGADAKAEILATDFTPEQDTVRLSLKAAYEVPQLKTLERTFVFSRQGPGSLTVTDRVAYTTPQTFETALIAYSDWQRLPDGKLMTWHADQAVAVEVKAEGGEIEIVPERIEEDGAVHPMRLGLRLTQPVTTAMITMTITPLAIEDKTGNLLRNGDFETSSFGWELPPDCQGSLSTEQAASGNASLKISDPDTKLGSNINSAPIPAPPGQDSYVLSGKVFHVSGSGIGMYMRFADAAGKSLNKADEKGNIAPVGSLSGAAGQWVDFRYPFKVEPGTTTMRLWIHSYSASVVEAYLDDLRVEAAK